MNWTEIETHWDRYAPQIHNRWGRLTEHDVDSARASREALLDRVLKRYGIAPDLAARHVDDWINSASPGLPPSPNEGFSAQPH
jgi:hypothetical protein